MSERVVGYRLHPKQAEAYCYLGLADFPPNDPRAGQPPVEELLYGGQAGGGKSHLLRAIGVSICARWPGVRVPLFRRKYTELEDSHIPWIQQEIRPPVATYSTQRHELVFSNKSVLMFRHCEHEDDVYDYLTAEWGGLLVDQAEMFTPDMIRFLRTRVRQPTRMRGWRAIIVYSVNPGGISHDYFRTRFVEVRVDHNNLQQLEGEGAPIPPGTSFQAPREEGGMRRCYFPAALRDNPSLDAEEYRRRLEGMPKHLRSAYLSGDWNLIPGAYFSEWQPNTPDGIPWHVWPEEVLRDYYGVAPEQSFPPPEWVRWTGTDGGVNDPWCTLWAARAPDRRTILYRELYGAGVPVPQQARWIRRTEEEHEEYLSERKADPAMFTKRANLTWSDAQVYAEQGVALSKGTNAREPGWRRVREHLTQLIDGLPQLVVVEGRCPNLVRTLPTLQTDRAHPEDILHGTRDKQEDHAADCLRYLVMPASVPDVVRVPKDIVTTPARLRQEPSDYRLGATGIRSSW